ncbi:nucleotide sugar dehydrogenase [Sandarakinorhabdus sp.]|uniref:nucleotide sugar dehydrogenase n=1 Tax=Sandarakinorhabdus sp. TaxID=1916663 RepID=UPI00286DFDE7|nr:nucleotide sugar dehydrogenase [Sandarakinorhabdus sp.]
MIDTQHLIKRFQNRDMSLGVIGLGYVGLPLCLAAAEGGLTVVGLDIDPAKSEAIMAGRSYLTTVSQDAVARHVGAGKLVATTDFSQLATVDVIVICVPTPLTTHREPDLSYIEATARVIAANLRPGQLVCLESTTWPGTTDEVVRPILDATGLVSGRDYVLAFSPEREVPGTASFGAENTPKVVGADDDVARALALAFYSAVTSIVVPVSSTRTAEATKLTENIFRAVNIAMVNELKQVYEAMGIDVWEVIDAAKTKPFGFMPFYPGPGLGGHCIPIDPFYLTWKAREFEIATRFIELAGEVNTAMPRYVVERTAQALDLRFGKGLRGARLLLMGVAYKKNVNDIRESPALKLIELFTARGALVDYADPHVPEIGPSREHARLAGQQAVEASGTALADYDVAVIVTDHDGFDYAALVDGVPLVIDTRNACARRGLPMANVVKA